MEQVIENYEEPITEEGFKAAYEKRILEFQCRNGCSPRKAKRALESIAKRKTKKFMKTAITRKANLEAEGKTFTATVED